MLGAGTATQNNWSWFGGVDNTQQDSGLDASDDRILTEARFKDRVSWFLQNCTNPKEERAKYKEQLELNIRQGDAKLVINLDDFMQFAKTTDDEKMELELNSVKESLVLRPTFYIPLLEESCRKFYDTTMLSLFGSEEERAKNAHISKLPSAKHLQVQLICNVEEDDDKNQVRGTGLPLRKIRKLLAEEVESLVMVAGIVVQCKSKRHKSKTMRIRCKNCGSEDTLVVRPGLHGVQLPKKCEALRNAPADNAGDGAGQAAEKCDPNPFVVVPDECDYWDMQEIKLQELPEDVPLGDMPRSITCFLNRSMVDTLQPGNRIAVIGVPINADTKSKEQNNRMGFTIHLAYLQAVGFVKGGELRVGPKLTPAEEEKFQEWARDGVEFEGRRISVVEAVARSVAPSICASAKDNIETVKKAVGCLLFGGAPKKLPDQTKLRGDINVLLLGDPSTAKSQFLKFVHRVAPVCVYTSGKGSSAAGLTAAIIKDNSNGGFSLEGGAMVLADGGVVCIDEFDKMRNDDRVAIHEAMEQQTISIAKAGITVVLNTRCSVLAAANPIYGSYDDQTSTAEQIDFASSILSRFDLIFLIRDVQDAERDLMLAKHVIRLHGASKNNHEVGNFVTPPIGQEDMKKFVTFAKRRCDPRLSREAATSLQANYIAIRQAMLAAKQAGNSVSLPITVRQLEAISRIAESLARMELTDLVSPEHVKEAFRLFSAATLEASANRKSASVGEHEIEAVKSCEEQVMNRVAIGTKVKRETLLRFLMDQGVDDSIAKKTIYILIQRKILDETENHGYKRVQ
mmetsp:Transcript_8989/g.21914  ORF Transcript_8989/g.21914 Transcript_8989/m.21914 type:complete len:796 (+) Transcript_8989:409-2796(+)|eukprot:CAMPEP_0178995662 /NCGR_PEP_ID=MMETSP0795-20121207/7940_1 /TAXON_ID=88552 /ORGANISM="Amoebophrya sp., Strain Ameob2" /LENGTH=795 /DNA_ID=CAMNT_0020687971 /DNA_START=378 /DNA_END=2765 /DNA_ORIENTATION=+